jgi:hypothetical protein
MKLLIIGLIAVLTVGTFYLLRSPRTECSYSIEEQRNAPGGVWKAGVIIKVCDDGFLATVNALVEVVPAGSLLTGQQPADGAAAY